MRDRLSLTDGFTSQICPVSGRVRSVYTDTNESLVVTSSLSVKISELLENPFDNVLNTRINRTSPAIPNTCPFPVYRAFAAVMNILRQA